MPVRWGARPRERESGSGCFCCARFGYSTGDKPTQAEQYEQRDDSLGDDAVETPYLENVFFDVSEIESECQAEQRGSNYKATLTHKGQDGQRQVPRDPDGRHRDVIDHGVGAVVHNAAVPFFVNRARLGAGGIVDLKCQ